VFNRRDYQDDCITDVMSSYERGVRSGLIVMATGMGKTFTTTELAKVFLDKYGGKALFLVDRIELAEQSRDAFLRTDPDLRVNIEMNTYKSKPSDQIVIACVATIGRKGSKRIKKFNPDEFTLIIADEGHLSVSPIWQRVLHYFGAHPDNYDPKKLLIGLTATPRRTDGVGLGFLYDDIFGSYDIVYGIREGWLTDIEWKTIETGVDISKVGVRGGEFNQTNLSETVNTEHRNLVIVKSYFEVAKEVPTMIFCASVAHAYQLADMFTALDIPAACIEGMTDKRVRRDNIAKFRSGEIKVLTNYSALGTGFDAPEIGCIMFARPIKSLLTYTQFLGRGLRPSSTAFVDEVLTKEDRLDLITHSTKPFCTVIDFCDFIGTHNVCNVPTLFGLSPTLREAKQKFFKEVVEPIEEVRVQRGIDVSDITSLDEIDLIVKSKTITFKSFKSDDLVKEYSSLGWLSTTEGGYEIAFPEKEALLIEKNLVDKYDLLHVNYKTGVTKKLNTFNDLSGAFKVGDEFADQTFDTKFLKQDSDWRGKPVSEKQFSLLTKLFKRGASIGRGEYSNGVRHLYIYQNGQRVFVEDSGMADQIIGLRLRR
jgi:superfamily II DNA or RNA helicase